MIARTFVECMYETAQPVRVLSPDEGKAETHGEARICGTKSIFIDVIVSYTASKLRSPLKGYKVKLRVELIERELYSSTQLPNYHRG